MDYRGLWSFLKGIGVVKLGMVKDASQVTAMERTLAGGVDYRKLTVNLQYRSLVHSYAEWLRAGTWVGFSR